MTAIVAERLCVDWGMDRRPRISGAISAVCALVRVVSAAHAPAGPERTYGKEKVYGSIP